MVENFFDYNLDFFMLQSVGWNELKVGSVFAVGTLYIILTEIDQSNVTNVRQVSHNCRLRTS